MRILFVTQLLPLPLDAGPKVRAYYVLRYLAEAGHDVRVVCFIRPEDQQANVDELKRFCGGVSTVPLVRSRMRDVSAGFRSLFSSTPFLVQRDQLPRMERKIREITEAQSFDAVHADQLWMAPQVSRLRNVGRKVLDQHNAVYRVLQRMAKYEGRVVQKAFLARESSKLEAFERATCLDFERVVWVSEEDRDALVSGASKVTNGDRSVVIPIATDPRSEATITRRMPHRITFLGGMHWPPNAQGVRWFVEKVWPRVSDEIPEAVLTLIGKRPPKSRGAWKCAERIEATGYLSNIDKHLAQTAVFVVPLLSGAGMRVKILDAWCWGLPVVSTSVGIEGMRSSNGENVAIADDPETFAEAVIRMMRDRGFADRISMGGRETVEQFYDWKRVYPAWDQIYN